MSRGRDNVSFMPDIEEPSHGILKVSANPPPEDDELPPIPEERQRKKRPRDDEKILKILTMLQQRVSENTDIIDRYILRQKDVDTKDEIKRKDKVQVETRVTFMKVVDIDTVEQKFKAEVFLQSRWLEPALKGRSDSALAKFRGEGIWDPKIIITNIVGEPEEDESWLLANRYAEFAFPAVTMRRRIKGWFSEVLELNDFPLDVQELTLQVSTTRAENSVVLVKDNYRMSSVNTHDFLDQDEFQIYPHVVASSGHLSSELSALRDSHSAIFFACSVKRKPGYFFWNIFLMMFLITTLMFSGYAIPPTNPHNRLAVSLTLLLTAIAFKFVMNKSIPQIPYLTYLDIYVISCVVLLVLQSIQNAVITAFAGTSQREIDLYCMYFLITCHVAFHLAFSIFLIVMNYQARALVKQRNQDYLIQKELVDAKRKKMRKPMDADMYTTGFL